MSNWTDTELKRLAFDYVRGELSLDDSELIESRMSESQEFADYVSRLQALLSSAKTTPPESFHPIEPDALFSKIAGALVAPEESEEEAELLELPVRRPWGILIALAALIVLGFTWFFIEANKAPEPAVVKIADREPVVVPQVERVTDIELDSLESKESEDDPLRVFASGDAKWNLQGGLDKKLTLDSGVLLVEYVPKAGERLSVAGRGFQVQVTGTVFYVSNQNGGVVGVVAGGVRVVPERGQPVQVKAGQEYVVNEGLRAIHPTILESASEHVDVQTHLDRLAHPHRVPADVERLEREEPVKKPARSQLTELRSQSQLAMKEGRYSEASELMERLVKQVPPSDAMAGAVRLDLARIYIQRLDRPERAAFHLKQFVVARPADAATPSAREELCRILSESERRDPLCDH